MQSPSYKPILCLDFDGVCHSYTSGWKGADVIPDPPVPGLFFFLEEAADYFAIHIFSSRSHQPGGRQAMMDWFDFHWKLWADSDRENNHTFPKLQFPLEKPPAMISLDDRTLLFTGTWPMIDDLRAFKPWNKT